ncbi:MAG: hypothetical protein LBC30_03970 [Puniceicoccales bacterium]|jgi:hypothetical protein|nr:hypothetical protein [Puniceicoccales bacterium]
MILPEKTMKNTQKYFLFLVMFLAFFHQVGWSVDSNKSGLKIKSTLSEIEKEKKNYSVDISRIIQGLVPFKTISLSYEIRESKDDGKTWSIHSRNKLCWDKESENMFFKSIRDAEKHSKGSSSAFPNVTDREDEVFSDKYKQIYIYKSAGKRSTATISKHKEKKWIDPRANSLLNYGAYRDNMPLFINGKLTLPGASIEKIELNGKTVIRISESASEKLKEFIKQVPNIPENSKFLSTFKITKKDDVRFIYLFDEKTGLLLQREEWYAGERYDKVDVKGYWQHNGFFFPSDVTIVLHDGILRRFIIDKDSLRINEIVDEKVFIPQIPAGCRVFDRIEGKQYVSPSIGNSEAEEQISRELDSLFKEANEQK